MRSMRRAAFIAVILPLLALMALLAPSASAATSAAVRPASYVSAEPPAPDAPFPSCIGQVTVTRAGKGSATVKVVAVNFSGKYNHKLWLTDTDNGILYGPWTFRTGTNLAPVTDTTYPVHWAVEVTYEDNETECAADYYA